MQGFDIDFDHDMFLEYVNELHEHLFGSLAFEELFDGVHNHHQKHHLVTLHLLKDKETFRRYYTKKEVLGISSIFDIIIGTLTENVAGDKIKEHLVAHLELTPQLKTTDAADYDKKVLMKNLKSFMMYSRKRKGVFNQ
ncbi:hypothetical protein [Brevibacillus borstelensis]|uniref:hypothetical protein n=1 Tax=Brevibacillus borstelensis TaxID=45462 RepID=UPI00113DE83F|nr:hypothetical protein [Brevibacillus borstelensis]MCM3470170.1 hypothetical protein [Brevibacillus borstelensis]MCM3591236.1 hypothetical protein [Brevibacillus borstelensis]TGV31247.1 hypothetical protein EN829_033695 [Mesorhizobium sp. M00.F.Ca.ET.186.01.1.1]